MGNGEEEPESYNLLRASSGVLFEVENFQEQQLTPRLRVTMAQVVRKQPAQSPTSYHDLILDFDLPLLPSRSESYETFTVHSPSHTLRYRAFLFAPAPPSSPFPFPHWLPGTLCCGAEPAYGGAGPEHHCRNCFAQLPRSHQEKGTLDFYELLLSEILVLGWAELLESARMANQVISFTVDFEAELEQAKQDARVSG